MRGSCYLVHGLINAEPLQTLAVGGHWGEERRSGARWCQFSLFLVLSCSLDIMRAHRPVHDVSHMSRSFRIVLHYTLHIASPEPIVTRSVTLHHTLHHTHPNIIVSRSVTGNMTCHDTGWQFHKITECTGVQHWSTCVTPGVHLYSHRQPQVSGPLTPAAQSVRASRGWHKSDTRHGVRGHCYKTQTIISHRMLNRRYKIRNRYCVVSVSQHRRMSMFKYLGC